MGGEIEQIDGLVIKPKKRLKTHQTFLTPLQAFIYKACRGIKNPRAKI